MKLDNILYCADSKKVKIVDFGFASSNKDLLKVFCGTPSYMAPEIVNKKEYRGDRADMWACGVVMYVMLTGYFPFKSQDEKGLFRQITKGIYAVAENEKN